jgi:hypothetical protein
MFPIKFQFEKNEVRTADVDPILLKIASVNKGSQENKKRDKSKKLICPGKYSRWESNPHSEEPDFESGASTNSAT